MALTQAEKQMLLDLRREINELKRERVRLRTGVVTDITGPTVKVRLGGECGGTEITAIANGPVAEGDVVTALDGGGGAVISGPALTGGESGLDQGSGIVINGKEIAVDSSVARKNGTGQLLGIGNPSDANHGANKQYVDIAVALSYGIIPGVGSLPSSPLPGYTVLFNGWLCRYDAAPPYPAYPWAVLGGNMFASSATEALLTSASFVSPDDPISLSIPAGIKGIFMVEVGGTGMFDFPVPASAAAGIVHGFRVNTGATEDDRGWMELFTPYNNVSTASLSDQVFTGSRKSLNTITAAGASINERARKMYANGSSVRLHRRWIEVVPKWIGT